MYTAKKNGNWNISTTWSMVPRNDNVLKDKFIIPAGIVVTGDDDVNSMGFDEVEIQLHGTLKLGPSASLHFGNSSKIEIFETGNIQANGASQKIFIGSVAKYAGNSNKTLKGPVYADFSTGIAPEGFSTYAVLPVSLTGFSATLNNHIVSLKWSAVNDRKTMYEVEQLANANDWSKINVMTAGENDGTHNYVFDDNHAPAGFISYRVKQVKEDGKFQYSNTVTVKQIEANGEAKIFSSNKTVSIQLSSEAKTVDVKIMNMNGHVMVSRFYSSPALKLNIPVANVNSGDYVVYISENNNLETVKKIFIN
jgi:hypothetical protein